MNYKPFAPITIRSKIPMLYHTLLLLLHSQYHTYLEFYHQRQGHRIFHHCPLPNAHFPKVVRHPDLFDLASYVRYNLDLAATGNRVLVRIFLHVRLVTFCSILQLLNISRFGDRSTAFVFMGLFLTVGGQVVLDLSKSFR